MDKSTMKGIVIGVAAAIAISTAAGYKMLNKTSYAEVLAVKEVTETVKTPRQECNDVLVQHQAPVKDNHQVAGTVLGAVVGGLVGNQVGGGTGKDIATAGGAVAGGYAGNKIQQNMQNSRVTTTTERQCKTVYDSSQKHVGYDVTYRLNEQQGVVRMDTNPGSRIPVKDGQLVLTSSGK